MPRLFFILAIGFFAGCGESGRPDESKRPAKKGIEAAKLPKAVMDSFEKNFPKMKMHDCFERKHPDGKVHGYEIRWKNQDGKMFEKEFGPDGTILDES
jgi:hypothetical protein